MLRFDKRQFCPTLNDLKNEELRRLAKRLKGNSEKETLANILEWEDRNLQYWIERRNLQLISIIAFFYHWFYSLFSKTYQ